MGALEIRMSSQNLKPLGNFRMPELDTGAAKMWDAQARAAERAAAAARTAGMAEVEGISRRGRIVADTLGHLGKLAMELFNRENERIATNAILASEQERNAFMFGDGTPDNPGQFNVEFDANGAENWLAGLKAENERRTEKYTKDLNAPQRRMYEEAMAKKEVEWQLRIGSHAAKKTLAYQITTAQADTKSALDEACAKFAIPEARDGAIADYYEKVKKEFDTRGLPESQRELFFRGATDNLLQAMPQYTFKKWMAETAASDDPDAVRKAWAEHRKLLDATDGKAPLNPLIRKFLGSDNLADDQMKFIKGHFEDSATKAVDRAKALRLTHIREDMEAFSAETAVKRADQLDPSKADGVEFDLAGFRQRLDQNPRLDAKAKAQLMEEYRAAYDYQQKYVEDKRKMLAADAEHKATYGYVDPETNLFIPASSFAKQNHPTAVYEFDPSDEAFWSDTSKASARIEAARMNGMLTEDFYKTCRKTLRNKSDEAGKKELEALLPYYAHLLPIESGYGSQPNADQVKHRQKYGIPKDIGFYAKTKSERGTPFRSAADFVADMTSMDAPTYTQQLETGRGLFGGVTTRTVSVQNPDTEQFIDWPTWNRCLDAAYQMRGMGVKSINEALQLIVAPSLKAGYTRTLDERLSRDGINAIVDQYRRETGYYDSVNDKGERTTGTLTSAETYYSRLTGKKFKGDEEKETK